MDNINRLVHISYVPNEIVYDENNQMILDGNNNPVFGNYFIATMPEVKTSATGSTHEESLTNLLAKVTALPNPAQNPLTWNRTS